MLQRGDGFRFIAFGTSVYVDGVPLLTRTPPVRELPQWFKQIVQAGS